MRTSRARNPPSFDKQFVRDWLEQSGWDKNSPPPPLPAEVVERTRAKYLEAYERLTDGRSQVCKCIAERGMSRSTVHANF